MPTRSCESHFSGSCVVSARGVAFRMPELSMIVSGIMRAEHRVAALTACLLVALGACSLLSVNRTEVSVPEQVLTLKLIEPSLPQKQVARAIASKRKPDPLLANLIVPVAGVTRSSLKDTWGAPRDSGRTHKGIDIMADKGTPVLAAASGKIIKLFVSAKGGTTIYQMDESGKYIFYYAHLERYADNLHPGQRVLRGEVIGYVGETGNAPVPHLHFEIQTHGAGRKWWRGVAMNPFPVLKSGHVELASRVATAGMK